MTENEVDLEVEDLAEVIEDFIMKHIPFDLEYEYDEREWGSLDMARTIIDAGYVKGIVPKK